MKTRERILLGTAAAVACLSGCESSVSGAPVSVAIIDDSAAPGETYDSVQQVGNMPFRDFIAGILSHAAARSSADEFEFVGREEADRAALVFVRLPVATSGDEALAPAPEPHASSDGCRVQSPWFELNVRKGATPGIEGQFVWNERQILQDLALLAGDTGQAVAPRQPLPQSTLQELAQLYARQAVLAPRESRSDEALEHSIPADILFLFRQAPQSTRGPFVSAVRSEMQTIAQDAVAQQVRLVKSLLDRCLNENSTNITVANAIEAATAADK